MTFIIWGGVEEVLLVILKVWTILDLEFLDLSRKRIKLVDKRCFIYLKKYLFTLLLR